MIDRIDIDCESGDRLCEYCFKVLVRDEIEPQGKFLARSTCNRRCSALLREERKGRQKTKKTTFGNLGSLDWRAT